MAIFFTADTHFSMNDFDGTIKRDFRPFSSLEEMNNSIIKNFNSVLTKSDTLYHLGDFINYNKLDNDNYLQLLSFVKLINANVVLLLGNNEERLLRERFDDNFAKFREYLIELGFSDVIKGGIDIDISAGEVSDYKSAETKSLKVYLNHYPINHKEGVLNLFGHIHSTIKVKKYGFNVGVDVSHFRPLSADYILYLYDCQKKFDQNVYN